MLKNCRCPLITRFLRFGGPGKGGQNFAEMYATNFFIDAFPNTFLIVTEKFLTKSYYIIWKNDMIYIQTKVECVHNLRCIAHLL